MTKKNHRLFVVVAFTALSVMAQAQMLPSKLLGHEQQIDDIIKGMTPAINIQRIPTGGRTYEYLSEDPLLSGMLSLRLLKGGCPTTDAHNEIAAGDHRPRLFLTYWDVNCRDKKKRTI
jgi:hypothetical protein